ESGPDFFIKAAFVTDFVDQPKARDHNYLPVSWKIELIDRAIFACQPHEILRGSTGLKLQKISEYEFSWRLWNRFKVSMGRLFCHVWLLLKSRFSANPLLCLSRHPASTLYFLIKMVAAGFFCTPVELLQ